MLDRMSFGCPATRVARPTLKRTRMAFDLLIKNAKTRFSEGLKDIGITAGRIASMGHDLAPQADRVIDAAGKLVTESFVNAHLHLCKVYTLAMAGQEALASYHGGSMGKAMTAIELASRVKKGYNETWILENVRKALNLAVRYGTTHIRAFADTDTKAKLEGVKALLQAREEFKSTVEIQVVAFPQDGVVRDPGAEKYVEQALQLGADVVGGIPWIEFTDEDARRHVDILFALARKYAGATDFLFLGRGINYPVALEGALKLKEISYIHAEGYSAAEIKHGPIALINEQTPSVFLVPDDSLREKVISNMKEVKARRGRVIAIGVDGDEEVADIADDLFTVPRAHELIYPYLMVVPLQLFAYYMALELGHNVDQPWNLAKSVTVE